MCELGFGGRKIPWAASYWSGQLGQWAKLKVTVKTLFTYCGSISKRPRGRSAGSPSVPFSQQNGPGWGLGRPERMADGKYLRIISLPRAAQTKASCFVNLRPRKWERLGVGKYRDKSEEKCLQAAPWPLPPLRRSLKTQLERVSAQGPLL